MLIQGLKKMGGWWIIYKSIDFNWLKIVKFKWKKIKNDWTFAPSKKFIFCVYDPRKQNYRQELVPNTQFQPCRVFVCNGLVEKKIRSRIASKQFLEFKKKLGLDPNEYSFDEQDIISELRLVFEGEIMHTQYCVQNKRLGLYFSKHKLGIEIDEYGHVDRNFEDEESRQLIIEEKLGCKIITTNPDAADFSIYRLKNQVRMHIEQSTIKSTKTSLTDHFSKRLLGIEFMSSHSIKS